MLVDTCSTAHRAPDGGVKFRAGLVVSVDEEPGGLDGVTARRWLRNAICEPYEGGVPGEVVTAEERVADVAALEAEMERLARLRDRAVAIAQGRELGVVRTPPVADDGAGRPIGAQPYAPEEDPLAVYGLADQQLEALKGAGFVRPDIIDNATDEELLEVVGVGERTVARLRGRRD
ncbi:MAG TPA: hypothetical protein VKB80_03240 [Kofleriaceae bacterium]|nr:hypothetical protein [Kofleriaceae bacterium]